mgnify:CR=1 FL=1
MKIEAKAEAPKSSVVKLVPRDDSEQSKMVEILEAALERAKAGELTGVEARSGTLVSITTTTLSLGLSKLSR